MNKHKEKCMELKKIRYEMAKSIGKPELVNLEPCTFEGNCKGTCPACEKEEKELNSAIMRHHWMTNGVFESVLDIPEEVVKETKEYMGGMMSIEESEEYHKKVEKDFELAKKYANKKVEIENEYEGEKGIMGVYVNIPDEELQGEDIFSSELDGDIIEGDIPFGDIIEGDIPFVDPPDRTENNDMSEQVSKFYTSLFDLEISLLSLCEEDRREVLINHRVHISKVKNGLESLLKGWTEDDWDLLD